MIDSKEYIVVISDDQKALLAAKAAGRAIVAVEASGKETWGAGGAVYVIPSFKDATKELAELVLRRHLGLPWTIEKTRRLLIRELVKEDAICMPREDCGKEEDIFCSPQRLEQYIKHQYGFYEYGTWAVTVKQTGDLIGLAGVRNPQFSEEVWDVLKGSIPWLELGYHIFSGYQRQGFGSEAVKAVADYSHQILGVRLCAVIHRDNYISCRLAEGVGMTVLREISTESHGAYLLYGERP